jgi:hypothetical protein
VFLSIKHYLARIGPIRVRGWLGVIAVEIMIVILGFYIGAGLSYQRQQAERHARLSLMVGALSTEIETFIDESSGLIESARADLEAWKSEYEHGHKPRPFVLAATASLSRPHATLWAAILGDGGLELLPLDLVTRLADFYDRSDRMVDRYVLVSSFSREYVLPHLDEAEVFYRPNSTELRESLRIHMLELEAVIRYAEETLVLGRDIGEHPFFAENE